MRKQATAETVSVLVIDCRRTGALPPTVTTCSPQATRAVRLRRGRGAASAMGLAAQRVGSDTIYFTSKRATLSRPLVWGSNAAPSTSTAMASARPSTTDRGRRADVSNTSSGRRIFSLTRRPSPSRTCTQDWAVARRRSAGAEPRATSLAAEVAAAGAEAADTSGADAYPGVVAAGGAAGVTVGSAGAVADSCGSDGTVVGVAAGATAAGVDAAGSRSSGSRGASAGV